MSQHPAARPPVQPMVFWIIWIVILSGLLVIQSFAPKATGAGDGEAGSMGRVFQIMALGFGAASMVVRFLVIPRLGTLEKKLPAMIVGLAMAEGIGIIGAFAVSPDETATRMFMLGVSVVCLVLSMPFYARTPDGGKQLEK